MAHNRLSVRSALLLIVPLAVAACGDQGDEETTPEPSEFPRPVEPGGGIGDGATAPAPLPDRTASLPRDMQGRWGLTPADCTTSDAEGLLTVAPGRLTFYESVGELGAISARTDNRVRGRFAFTGEGMNWTRDISLTLEDGGRTLVRREHGSEASPGAFTYIRCS